LGGPIQTSLRSIIGAPAPQKTFVLDLRAFSTPREAEQKFFGSFFQKRTAFLLP
jgi:hypothetical protein